MLSSARGGASQLKDPGLPCWLARPSTPPRHGCVKVVDPPRCRRGRGLSLVLRHGRVQPSQACPACLCRRRAESREKSSSKPTSRPPPEIRFHETGGLHGSNVFQYPPDWSLQQLVLRTKEEKLMFEGRVGSSRRSLCCASKPRALEESCYLSRYQELSTNPLRVQTLAHPDPSLAQPAGPTSSRLGVMLVASPTNTFSFLPSSDPEPHLRASRVRLTVAARMPLSPLNTNTRHEPDTFPRLILLSSCPTDIPRSTEGNPHARPRQRLRSLPTGPPGREAVKPGQPVLSPNVRCPARSGPRWCQGWPAPAAT